MWTPGFPMKTFIYMKDKTELLWKKKKKAIYEYIYVYVKLGKINILIRGIFLYWF